MACRLCNRSSQPIRVDLRGGGVLHLAPGATSPALLEEQLYDNMFLPKWERDGTVVRLPSKFSEVAAKNPAPAGARARKAAKDPAADKNDSEKKDRKSKGKTAT
jgi:hypothetical protein